MKLDKKQMERIFDKLELFLDKLEQVWLTTWQICKFMLCVCFVMLLFGVYENLFFEIVNQGNRLYIAYLYLTSWGCIVMLISNMYKNLKRIYKKQNLFRGLFSLFALCGCVIFLVGIFVESKEIYYLFTSFLFHLVILAVLLTVLLDKASRFLYRAFFNFKMRLESKYK